MIYLFCLTKQLRYVTYGLETCYSYISSIKHTYISIVKQTISTSEVVQSFFFLLSGVQYRILNNNNDNNNNNNNNNNSNVYISILHLREAPGGHTYLPKKTGIFPVKILRN